MITKFFLKDNEKLLHKSDDVTKLILRLSLGLVMFPHGAQKLFGWFGGYGFTGTMDFFTGIMGIPWILGFLAIIAEFFGALGLLFGIFTRISAFGIAIVMTVAILTSHIQYGFFMNWSGAQPGEGFEFHLLALGLSAALIINGSGRLSVSEILNTKAAD